MIKGRAFDEHDAETSMRVAIANEFFVNRFLDGVDPAKNFDERAEISALPGNLSNGNRRAHVFAAPDSATTRLRSMCRSGRVPFPALHWCSGRMAIRKL
jgi:hypothetical protein